MRLTPSQRSAADRAASSLGIETDWLLAVIQNESGGDPQIKNPTSSARGLIQFMDATARGMGFSGSAALLKAYPTFEEQVTGPVVDYYKAYAPFSSRDEFLTSAFYPAYRHNLDRQLPLDVRAANPGFNTLRDYADRVWSKYTGVKALEQSLPFLSIAAGLGLWIWCRNRR